MQKVIFSEKSSIYGRLTAPPSKSHSHRLLFLALISNNPIKIRNILRANDVNYSIQACKQLGMQIEETNSEFEDQIAGLVCTPPMELKSVDEIIDCGNSGTTVRLLMGLSIAIQGKLSLTGDFFKRKRPFLPMLEGMNTIGTLVSTDTNGVTLETPQITDNYLKIPGHFSSQFISGLIFGIIGLSLHPEMAQKKNFGYKTFTIETTTPQVSVPYIELTKHIFEHFGIELLIEMLPNECVKICIPIKKITHFKKDEFEIPGDYSAIAPLLCGATLFGRKEGLHVRNLSDSNVLINHEIVEILEKIGLKMSSDRDSLKFYSSKKLFDTPKELAINCKNFPDLFPSLCILGAYLPGTTTLTQIGHIRFKESNRVEVMTKLLAELGVQIKESDNSVRIHGNPKIPLHKSHTISDILDHRVLMSLIIFAIGLEYNGHQLTIRNVEYIADSYPQFLQDLQIQNGVKFETKMESD